MENNKNTERLLSEREEKIQEATLSALLSIKTFFASPVKSFLWLFGFALAVSFFYAVFILSAMPDGKQRQAELSGMVSLSSAGYLELQYKDAKLEKRFSRVRINEVKELIEADIERLRESLFDQRVAVLTQAAFVLCDRYRNNLGLHNLPPTGLLQLAETRTLPIEIFPGESSSTVNMACGRQSSSGSGSAFRSRELLRRQALVEETISFFSSLDMCSKTNTRNCGVVAALESQLKAENEIFEDAKQELVAVEDDLSFGFLAAGGEFGWIFHLMAWSWFGVVASSLVGMSTSIIQKRYDGLMFGFICMKFILAPLIAIVIAAIFSAGLTQNEINLAHQPMFLIFAFFSGFFSERMTEILRMAANAFFAAARVDKSSFDRVTARVDRYRPLRRMVDYAPATTMPGLRISLEAAGTNTVADLTEERILRRETEGRRND